jgi:hypothetical protein
VHIAADPVVHSAAAAGRPVRHGLPVHESACNKPSAHHSRLGTRRHPRHLRRLHLGQARLVLPILCSFLFIFSQVQFFVFKLNRLILLRISALLPCLLCLKWSVKVARNVIFRL